MGVSGRRNRQSLIFVTMTGFTTPSTIAQYDLGARKEERQLKTWKATILKGLDPEEFVAEQVCGMNFCWLCYSCV